MTPPPSVDLTRLLKLRLVVALYGEMDAARWWNNRSMLGHQGVSVLVRGFPRTHISPSACDVCGSTQPLSRAGAPTRMHDALASAARP
jgi:hypothetical protein